MIRKIILSALLMLFVCLVEVRADEKSQLGKQAAAKLNTTVPVKMNYLLYLPENYEQQEK